MPFDNKEELHLAISKIPSDVFLVIHHLLQKLYLEAAGGKIGQ